MKVDRSLGLVGVLLEPTTVVAKAWEQVQAVGQRAFWEPQTVLVTGAGPIGLLAALVAKQHGMEVHVLDRMSSGPKPDLVRALGATYHSCTVPDLGFQPDVIVECTGVGQVTATRFRRSEPAASCASPASAAADARPDCRRATWPPRSSCGTT
jgi:glucose 1-dehydrogenase